MIIKLLQLNIFKGKFFPKLLSYIRQNDFDILHFQEVTGGSFSFNQVDCFEEIKKQLDYHGELVICWRKKSEEMSYFGNATFFKKSLFFEQKAITRMKPYLEIDNPDTFIIQEFPRSALSLQFVLNNKPTWFVNTHLAWGPNSKDEDHKVIQGTILFNHVKILPHPFVLSGDFNIDNDSQIVKMFEGIGKNLAKEHKVTNTLNPKIHKARSIFPPGLPVDFIFTHPTIRVKEFALVDKPDLSDHFGLRATFEF